jgi:UV DNA damage endonuclease
MALGLCCQWLEPDKKGRPKNVLISRNLQLGRFNKGEYSRERIKQTFIDNLQNLLDVFPKVIEAGIRSLRVSSSLFPLFDKVDKKLAENPETDLLFAKIGLMALSNKVRITTHPGQFTVISSDSADVVDKSIRELEYHAWMFDKMGLPKTPYYSINIHGGKGNRREQLMAGISRLNGSARRRLTLENCEFAYSVKDLEPIARDMRIPICFDSHHHRFNTGGLSGKEAMAIAVDTWLPGIKPMTHLSNSKPEYAANAPATKLRQHSDYLYEIPDYQLDANNRGLIDIEIEAKMKNLAILKAVDDLGLKLA